MSAPSSAVTEGAKNGRRTGSISSSTSFVGQRFICGEETRLSPPRSKFCAPCIRAVAVGPQNGSSCPRFRAGPRGRADTYDCTVRYYSRRKGARGHEKIQGAAEESSRSTSGWNSAIDKGCASGSALKAAQRRVAVSVTLPGLDEAPAPVIEHRQHDGPVARRLLGEDDARVLQALRRNDEVARLERRERDGGGNSTRELFGIGGSPEGLVAGPVDTAVLAASTAKRR